MKRIISVLVLLGLVAALFAAQPVRADNGVKAPSLTGPETKHIPYGQVKWWINSTFTQAVAYTVYHPYEAYGVELVEVRRCFVFMLFIPVDCTTYTLMLGITYAEETWLHSMTWENWTYAVKFYTADNDLKRWIHIRFTPAVGHCPPGDPLCPPLPPNYIYPAPMGTEKQVEPTAPAAKAKKTKVPAYP